MADGEHIAVIGSRRLFNQFMSMVDKSERSLFYHVSRLEHCRGVRFVYVIRLGDWRHLPDAPTLHAAAMTRSLDGK